MHTTGFPSTRERDDATLIGVIAAVRAQAPLSQPARVDILLTQGLDALLEEVFGKDFLPGPIHSPASEALVGGFSGPIAFGEAQSGSSGA